MRKTAAAVALILLAASPPAIAAEGAAAERFRYRWHLGSLLGAIAGLFLPSHGDGLLTFEPSGDGTLTAELLITSEKSAEGEYWRYGSKIDPETGRTLEAWSSYLFRGEQKRKRGEIEQEGVVDVAAAIFRLRRDPPAKPRHLEIWSDGKIYPVVVIPVGEEAVRVDGREIASRHLSVRGLRLPDRRHWKGRLELWLARDEAATPVRIHVERRMIGVRLELAEVPAGQAAARPGYVSLSPYGDLSASLLD